MTTDLANGKVPMLFLLSIYYIAFNLNCSFVWHALCLRVRSIVFLCVKFSSVIVFHCVSDLSATIFLCLFVVLFCLCLVDKHLKILRDCNWTSLSKIVSLCFILYCLVYKAEAHA